MIGFFFFFFFLHDNVPSSHKLTVLLLVEVNDYIASVI